MYLLFLFAQVRDPGQTVALGKRATLSVFVLLYRARVGAFGAYRLTAE